LWGVERGCGLVGVGGGGVGGGGGEEEIQKVVARHGGWVVKRG
jgi:hypothetical protein